MLKRLNSDLEGGAQIKHLAACYLEFARTHNALWSSLFELNVPTDIERPDWYTEKIKVLFLIVEQAISPIVDNKKKAEDSAKTIWASIHGICVLGLTGKLDVVGAQSLQVLMDGLIDNYIKGITA